MIEIATIFLFIENRLFFYIIRPNHISPLSTLPSTPYLTSPPDPLTLCFPPGKSRPPREDNKAWHSKIQEDKAKAFTPRLDEATR